MTYLAGWAIERDVTRVASEHPALWREIRRFNLPVKLALAAAQRVLPVLAEPRTAQLVGLAPCRPGSPELRTISRDLDAGFARGSTKDLRVNPIYTLHAIDNLALSALAIRIENRERCACFGGAAGQVWEAIEHAHAELEAGRASEALLFGGDQSDASWRGEPADAEACGAAIVLTSKPDRIKLVGITRSDGEHASPAPHAARGLTAWLSALSQVPAGRFSYEVPLADGDGIDRITLVVEVS